MFKKLKDKLAEEVKSSPQRIQQFAQAAQAAVTSASSSISDITNSELFSIGDNDSQQSQSSVKTSLGDHKNTFQDVSLAQSGNQSNNDSLELASSHDYSETPRQRRLSNSSFTSDISFRLPSYESPSMYHLQSDMEISASEAEERFSGSVSLDRVTKEQIYAAYRRTQERYAKYRTQYADLARHYKLLERENAKARSVLVETQDKALRRISELREQCSLEQSAKAHLEKALRVELEEKNLKIDTLNTKIQFLQQNTPDGDANEIKDIPKTTNDNNVQLITFDNENNQMNHSVTPEIETLNNKIDKLEKLVNKYKDSLKTSKEKNAQLTTEIQILTTELEAKKKNIDELELSNQELDATKKKVQELNELNEQLQNKVNAFDFNKSKELSTLELDLQKSQEEIAQLRGRIEKFTKREEEYAISLAENKLSIHKELEGKENEIKSLKDLLTQSKQEVQSLNIVITDYKKNISQLEDECAKHKNDSMEIISTKTKISELESQLQVFSEKCAALEISKAKADEEYKCLQLQLNQETAEKLAMIDRNTYLEERNKQLSDENNKKTLQIKALDNDLESIKKERQNTVVEDSSEKQKLLEEISLWKNKYSGLEAEIQEERDELVKLQSEIEKLLANDELLQIQNNELNVQLDKLKTENKALVEKITRFKNIKKTCDNLMAQVKNMSHDLKALKDKSNEEILELKNYVKNSVQKLSQMEDVTALKASYEEQKSLHYASRMELKQVSEENQLIAAELGLVKEENIKLKQEINNNELKQHDIEEELQQMKDELQSTCNDKKVMEEKIKELLAKYAELQNSLIKDGDEQIILKKDMANMAEKIKSLEHNEISLKTHISKLEKEQEEHIIKMNGLKDERESLTAEIKNVAENKHAIIETLQNEVTKISEENISLKKQCETISKLTKEQDDVFRQINTLKQENALLVTEHKKYVEQKQRIIEELQENVNDLKQENLSLKTNSNEITSLRKELEEYIGQISTLKEENSLLVNKHQSEEEKKLIVIEGLQDNLKDLTQENISLKTQFEKITNSVKELEVELREVRKSHADIEVEKDRLSSIIEDLEKRQHENKTSNIDTQTEPEKIHEIIEKAEAVKDSYSENATVQNMPEDSEVYKLLARENDSLKEENKRLQSDVTGLQAYLAKISKENSELNDKLRELIACSENSSDKKEINHNLIELKEKLDNLIRENSLLVEENFELKDQLSSHNYMVPGVVEQNSSGDYLNLQEKYNNIMGHNNELEKRIVELETMYKSANGNMIQIQEKNEKLRLTNEKLERRLDESLVSLRHLHSLQENTELEYLRNILYEYLTGTGAHSVTLAKVLAAVVKFDERQTQQVLQKEKERQGILRQLGII